MSNKEPYKSFSNYILRTPLFSFSSYEKFTSKKIISDDDFKSICNNSVFKEALFLASPSLSNEMNRWLDGEIEDKNKQEKLKYSILKYVSRMSSRCTPFGLFAGCSVGSIGDSTEIILREAKQNKRHTRLDMNYLVALSQDLIKNETIREQLLFFPNSSIYKVGYKLRYIEYNYIKGKRQHQIVAVDNTEYLDKILSKALKGALSLDLAKTLVDDDITLEEANEFIEELISSQLLISELEPSVSGPEFLDQIYSVLEKLNGTEDILKLLKEADQKINRIDTTIGNDLKKYLEISESLKKLKTDFQLKFMFQTDMILNTKKNVINREIIDDIKKGFILLNKITLPPKSTLLKKFKEAFYERFEDREVSLSTALDVEIGVGYKQEQSVGDVSPLVDDLVVPRKSSLNTVMEIKWNSINTFFQRKLRQVFKSGSYTLTLTEDDFKDYEVNWEDIPDTISSMIEIVDDNGKQKIKYSGGGGSSAANLLGRFCYGDEELLRYTLEIIDKESKANTDKILAEIVHLPESRVGNILMRPDLRKYEIPYLAKSIKKEEYQLPLDDLMISIRNKRKILLRSKKFNKEVIPYLTNAHNYSNNSLPIYHFLADMQTQNMRSGIGFSLGPFAGDFEFLPRVEYNNLILHDATWNLKKSHLEPLIKQKGNDNELIIAIKVLREHLKIPQFVMLVEGDNELLINFENLTSVKMLIDTVSERHSFQLTEFLFSENGIVKQGKEYYTNQIIVSFFNQERLYRSKNTDDD